MHDTEDRRLLRGVRRRDPDTYEQLITRYSRLLWSVAAAILPAAASEELAITKAQAGRALAYFQCQKEPDRRILTLRYLYELMPAAIAEILELTPRQVSNCLYYHRARLLSHLEKG